MSDALLDAVAGRFVAFTAPYLSEPGDSYAYALKVEHTARVVGVAREIATAEGVGGELLTATLLAAQLHDLGRFPQYRKYRTFRDASSANHAALSVKHSLRAGLLEGIPGPIKRIALGAVFLHNKRSIPARLPEGLRTAAWILRDSDKLDIYPVLIAHFAKTEPDHPEVAHGVAVHPTAYSDHVVAAIERREMGDYATIKWTNDFKLNAAAWVYDLNFRSSCRMLRDRGYIETIFDSLPRDEKLLALRRQITGDLARMAEGA